MWSFFIFVCCGFILLITKGFDFATTPSRTARNARADNRSEMIELLTPPQEEKSIAHKRYSVYVKPKQPKESERDLCLESDMEWIYGEGWRNIAELEKSLRILTLADMGWYDIGKDILYLKNATYESIQSSKRFAQKVEERLYKSTGFNIQFVVRFDWRNAGNSEVRFNPKLISLGGDVRLW